MKFLSGMTVLVVSAFLMGCATTSATYDRPTHKDDSSNYVLTLNKDFETVWKELVSYSASNFFKIDNYEKDSGLITLSFGASNPSEFVTGGKWHYNQNVPLNPGNNYSFDGEYVDFLMENGGTFTGRMNLVVQGNSGNNTTIKINARYVVMSDSRDTWVFNTGNCSVINVQNPSRGTGRTREICPTYKAEKAIINAMKFK